VQRILHGGVIFDENKIWGQNYAHWKEYILFTMQIEKPVFNFFS